MNYSNMEHWEVQDPIYSIIIGVKYCFRYNRRARLSRDENGNPIDLATIPRARRRREKKLMSMDDVNERFPLTKYKVWRATREQQGLPAEGGVTAPPSRAGSIKEGLGLARITSEGTSVEDSIVSEASTSVQPTRPLTASTSEAKDFAGLDGATVGDNVDIEKAELAMAGHAAIDEEEDVEDDDPIRNSVPPEMLMAPGDTCAICIDTLEDDDEVRGLTCGHAFHAGCLDPWLTSRRACCPLCKADYYVPKRAEVDPTDEPAVRRRPRRNQPGNPTHRHSMFTRPSSMLFDNRRFSMPEWSIFRRQQEELAAAEESQSSTQQSTPQLDGHVEVVEPAQEQQAAPQPEQQIEQQVEPQPAAEEQPQQPSMDDVPAAVPRPRRARGHSMGEQTRRWSSRFNNFRLSLLRQDSTTPAVAEQQNEAQVSAPQPQTETVEVENHDDVPPAVPRPRPQPRVEAVEAIEVAEQQDEVPAAVPRPRPQQQTETTERNRQSRRLSRFANLRLPGRRHENSSTTEQQEPAQQPQQPEQTQRNRRMSWIGGLMRPRLPSFLSRTPASEVHPATPGQLEAGLPAAIRV